MPPGCLDAVKQRCGSVSLSADPKCTVYRTVFFFRVQICQNVANFVKGTYTGIYDAVFRIRIQIRSGFRGPLDPDPDSDSMNMDRIRNTDMMTPVQDEVPGVDPEP